MRKRLLANCTFVLLLVTASPSHAQAQDSTVTLTPIFAFNQQGTDGFIPGGLVMAPDGTLFGVTGGLGVTFEGTVFQLTPPSADGGQWTHTTLHIFTSSLGDGASPSGNLIIGSDGSLYGITETGGSYNAGIAYRLIPPTHNGDPWTESILHEFGSDPNDGAAPFGGLAFGPNGVLYGTTSDGGPTGQGTVYQLTPPADPKDSWTESVIHYFEGSNSNDGAIPFAGVLVGPNGALYGTTFDGGAAVFGTVFELNPPAAQNQTWKISILHSFTGGDDGNQPANPVVLGKDGGIYGSTRTGGVYNQGLVFKLAQDSAGLWTEHVLYSFGCCSGSPTLPQGPLVVGANESIFGATQDGGDDANCDFGCGTVFRLDPIGAAPAWFETTLHTFSGGFDGSLPATGIILGRNGTAYGTNEGGVQTFGLVFQLQVD